MEKPNYYGILPANVRYDKRLKPMEKILYSEITALSNTQGFCFASNSYFAKLYEVNKKTVGVWVNNLFKFGYLKVELIYKENSKEVLERRLYIVDLKEVSPSASVEKKKEDKKIIKDEKERITPPHKKMDTPPQKNREVSPQNYGYPNHKKMEDNTTRDNSINENITSNNTTTKLDRVNEKEDKKFSAENSSSFVLEKFFEEKRVEESNKEKNGDKSNLIIGKLEKDLELSKIIYILFEFGVSDRTIENILKLDITLERVEEVLKTAKEKNWGEGAIYQAIKEKWILGEKKESIPVEELEGKKRWLNYFAGLDKESRGEILELIKYIPLKKLEKNKRRLARIESIFGFKEELKKLKK